MTITALFAKLRGRLRGTVRNLDPEFAVTSATIATAGRIYWSRLLEGGAITKVRVAIIAQSGNLCIAFAPNSGTGITAAPGTRSATTGSVASPAIGDADINLTAATTVQAGDWVGIAADNSTISLRAQSSAGVVDTTAAAGSAWRETIASGSPVIPSSRAALTAHVGRNWLIVGL